MLHKNVQIVDVDVDHWRNLQDLFIESSKEKRRIIVIHENGQIAKFIHSDRIEIVRPVERIKSAQDDVKAIYEANRETVDFVMVLERRAVEKYMAQIQDAWSADEDIDEYVHRMYATLAEYEDGIATYPGAAGMNLGLQWRIGISYEELQELLGSVVHPNSKAILAIMDGDNLWASLVLGFDSDRKIDLITSVPVKTGERIGNLQDASTSLVSQVSRLHGECALGLFSQLKTFRAWLRSDDCRAEFAQRLAAGEFILMPEPQ